MTWDDPFLSRLQSPPHTRVRVFPHMSLDWVTLNIDVELFSYCIFYLFVYIIWCLTFIPAWTWIIAYVLLPSVKASAVWSVQVLYCLYLQSRFSISTRMMSFASSKCHLRTEDLLCIVSNYKLLLCQIMHEAWMHYQDVRRREDLFGLGRKKKDLQCVGSTYIFIIKDW